MLHSGSESALDGGLWWSQAVVTLLLWGGEREKAVGAGACNSGSGGAWAVFRAVSFISAFVERAFVERAFVERAFVERAFVERAWSGCRVRPPAPGSVCRFRVLACCPDAPLQRQGVHAQGLWRASV